MSSYIIILKGEKILQTDKLQQKKKCFKNYTSSLKEEKKTGKYK